jgi:hypothetical protein
MTHLRIFVGAATLLLAVSSAFFSSAATGPKIVNKAYNTTLYDPSDCTGFSCGAMGTVSCNLYNTNPPSAPGRQDCSIASPNSLVHL